MLFAMLNLCRDKFSEMFQDFQEKFVNDHDKMDDNPWNDMWNEFPENLKRLLLLLPGRLSDEFFDGLSFYFIPKEYESILLKMVEKMKIEFDEYEEEFWSILRVMFKIVIEKFPVIKTTSTWHCITYQNGMACPGDSGGPIVTKPADADGVTPGENYEQIGMISFINNPCNVNGGAVYAKVTDILDWINLVVGTGHNNCIRE